MFERVDDGNTWKVVKYLVYLCVMIYAFYLLFGVFYHNYIIPFLKYHAVRIENDVLYWH